MHTTVQSYNTPEVPLPFIVTSFPRGVGQLVSVLTSDNSEGVIRSVVREQPNVQILLNENQNYNSKARLGWITDWILPLKFGSVIKTPNWDVILRYTHVISTTWHNLPEICLLTTKNFEYFFIRRKVFEVLGHLSLNPNNDNWIVDVMYAVDSVFPIPIEIESTTEVDWSFDNNGSNDDDTKKLMEYICNNRKGYNHPNRVKIWSEFKVGKD